MELEGRSLSGYNIVISEAGGMGASQVPRNPKP